MDDKLISLGDNRYALKFPYAMATDYTVGLALSRAGHTFHGKPVKFAPESSRQAYKRRMDSAEMEAAFPPEVALLRHLGHNLADYILIKVD